MNSCHMLNFIATIGISSKIAVNVQLLDNHAKMQYRIELVVSKSYATSIRLNLLNVSILY